MAEKPSSSWRKLFSRRDRSATGRENPKEQISIAVQNSAVSSSAQPAASNDAAQASTANTPVYQPDVRLKPIESHGVHSATSASSSPPPANGSITSGEKATTANAHPAASLPERLWDRAYDDLKGEDSRLLDAYEKILSYNLDANSTSSTASKLQPNAIVQNDPDSRRRQMEQLVHTGLDKTAREAKVKGVLGSTIDVVLSARDTISFAIQAMPQAALAWSGVCIGLEVSAPTNGYFTS
jgi:hypothetical protein